MSVECSQAEISSSVWSPFRNSPTEWGVPECDTEASIMRMSWLTSGTPVEVATWKIQLFLPSNFRSYLRYPLSYRSLRLRKLNFSEDRLCNKDEEQRYNIGTQNNLVPILKHNICMTYFTLWIRVKYFLFPHSWLACLLNIALYICIYIYIDHVFHVWRPVEDTQRSTELHDSWNIPHSATLLAVNYFSQFTCEGLAFILKSYPGSNDTINTTSSIIYTS